MKTLVLKGKDLNADRGHTSLISQRFENAFLQD